MAKFSKAKWARIQGWNRSRMSPPVYAVWLKEMEKKGAVQRLQHREDQQRRARRRAEAFEKYRAARSDTVPEGTTDTRD